MPLALPPSPHGVDIASGESEGEGESARGHPNGARRWHWDIYNAGDLTARCAPEKLPLTRRFVYSPAGAGREPGGPGGGGGEEGGGRRNRAERSCAPTWGARARRGHAPQRFSRAPHGHPTRPGPAQDSAWRQGSSPPGLATETGGSNVEARSRLVNLCRTPASRQHSPHPGPGFQVPFPVVTSTPRSRNARPGNPREALPLGEPTAPSASRGTKQRIRSPTRGGESCFCGGGACWAFIKALRTASIQRVERRAEPSRHSWGCFPVGNSVPLSAYAQEGDRTRTPAPGAGLDRQRLWAPAHVTDCPVVFSRPRIPLAGRIS